MIYSVNIETKDRGMESSFCSAKFEELQNAISELWRQVNKPLYVETLIVSITCNNEGTGVNRYPYKNVVYRVEVTQENPFMLKHSIKSK